MNASARIRASLAAALAAAAITAHAQPASAPAPAATIMSFQQVIDRLVAQGYRDIREIERKSDKLYEVEARNDKGQRVELDVDARSGEILALDVEGRR